MRAQAHTLEAIVSGMLLLASLVFALQMTAVTPLSASTSSQHIENQQQAIGHGVLASAAAEDALKPAVLYWDNSTAQFHNTAGGREYYTNGPPDNRFGELLERAFDQRGIAYNVYLRFQNMQGRTVTTRYIYSGEPSDNAVRASHTITLMDDDHLRDADGTRNSTRLGDPATDYTVSDTGTNVYNTVSVEVVAWRI
ncbi:hypothetical protein BVU17_09765 [Haloarcula taiwanensis]|uniref:Uncharacterized protein n=1 Tax=Haloarcula taiwanensis TaxID=1932004 RepID=A0A2H4ZZ76_9EURY|nr:MULTISPECIES: hypothetical protein [Haloarcula]AUG47786.1 hypothetical protein BVU17_09765 [Haloarcula taiwanensis]RLM39093.1 hypothetical protein DVK01_00620 [Haloarcula sp. Atlit-120R]RLM47037.1 hypothetical protein DVK00_00620 [Haloarcula sp. Atlit-47R]